MRNSYENKIKIDSEHFGNENDDGNPTRSTHQLDHGNLINMENGW